MRIVIKIGSNILASDKGLNQRRMESLAKNISALKDMGHEIVLVSSGAVAAGARKMGLSRRPVDVQIKQAAAAVGQTALMWAYERCFKNHNTLVAQVLLTRDGLTDRTMYLNAKNTLLTLIEYGIIPIINENDTVATDEIKFGDNDHLAALVSPLVQADKLIILSDVDGLYDKDPNLHKGACTIDCVKVVTKKILGMAGDVTSSVGTGGMYSKLMAAEKATASGVSVHIINGRRPSLLLSLMDGKAVGTTFEAKDSKLSARKGWIAYGSKAKGNITLDDGAVSALLNRNKSLLPSGITAVEGKFKVGDAVACLDGKGNRIAKGIINYSSDEVVRIMGKKTSQIENVLGYKYSDEVIHRDNLVLST